MGSFAVGSIEEQSDAAIQDQAELRWGACVRPWLGGVMTAQRVDELGALTDQEVSRAPSRRRSAGDLRSLGGW